MMHKLTCSLLICLMTAGLLPAKAHAAPASLYDTFFERIASAIQKIPATVGESNVALYDSKIADLKSLIIDTQDKFIKIALDMTNSKTALTVDEFAELSSLYAAAIVVLDNFQFIVNGAEGSINDIVNRLTGYSWEYRNNAQRVNGELVYIRDLGQNMSWDEWYWWLYYWGGLEYYNSVLDEAGLMSGQLSYIQDVRQNLNIYNSDDYQMPLTTYYTNMDSAFNTQQTNGDLMQLIGHWINGDEQLNQELSYWASQGVSTTVITDSSLGLDHTLVLYYYDWVLLGGPGDFHLAWACIYSYDLGITWWYSFQ